MNEKFVSVYTTPWMQNIATRAMQQGIPIMNFMIYNGRWVINSYFDINEMETFQELLYCSTAVKDLPESVRVGPVCEIKKRFKQ